MDVIATTAQSLGIGAVSQWPEKEYYCKMNLVQDKKRKTHDEIVTTSERSECGSYILCSRYRID